MATALIVIPIALQAAKDLEVCARPVLMCVTVSAAAALLTPVATPANLMVMEPGGYRVLVLLEARAAAARSLRRRRRAPRPGLLVVLTWSTAKPHLSRPGGSPRRRSSRAWWTTRASGTGPTRKGRARRCTRR